MPSVIQYYSKYDPKGVSVILFPIQLRMALPITLMLDVRPMLNGMPACAIFFQPQVIVS